MTPDARLSSLKTTLKALEGSHRYDMVVHGAKVLAMSSESLTLRQAGIGEHATLLLSSRGCLLGGMENGDSENNPP